MLEKYTLVGYFINGGGVFLTYLQKLRVIW